MPSREYLERIGKTWPVLDDGLIELRDVMGSDAAICADARVTTGAKSKGPESDRALIRSLIRRNEMSPFEQAHVKMRIRLPIHVARQLLRYRSAHVQEYSTRYAEAIDSAQRTAPDAWRRQSEDSRQGSGGPVEDWPDAATRLACTEAHDSPGEYLSYVEASTQADARKVYEERLAFGVAREQARKDLPLSTYTEIIFTQDLRNLLHLLAERWPGSAAQHEIAEYARVIGDEIVSPLFPGTWDAFRDYRLEALSLSRLDRVAIARLALDCPQPAESPKVSAVLADIFPNARERSECLGKLTRLGLLFGDPVVAAGG